MDIVNRIKHFMDTTGTSISQFSDRCGIPRPSMSQMLSGRNKRVSDEVISKIHNAYPELSIMWLLFGEGEMVPTQNTQISEPQNANINMEATPQQPHNEPSTLFNGATATTTEFHSDNLEGGKSADLQFPQPQFEPENGNDEYGPSLFDVPAGTASNSTPLSAASPESGASQPAMFHPIDIAFTNGTTDTSEAATNVVPASPGTAPIATATENPRSSQPTIPASQRPFAPQPQQGEQRGQHPSVATTSTSTSTGTPTFTGKAVNPETGCNNTTEPISIIPDARKKITNIVVFYSDNSFQSFLPES